MSTPDSWQPFGYKTAWLAIPHARPEDVVAALGLEGFVPCTWRAGVAGAYDGHAVFVTPSVDDHVLVIGDFIVSGGDAVVAARLAAMSERFDEVNLYISQRVLDVYQMMCARGGEVVTNMALADEDEVLMIAGLIGPNPTTFAHREGAPPPGLAAPDPTPTEGRTRAVRRMRQPAMPSVEAVEDHAQSTFNGCPSCRSRFTALYVPGRMALPWEDFAVELTLQCSDCNVRHALEYPVG